MPSSNTKTCLNDARFMAMHNLVAMYGKIKP